MTIREILSAVAATLGAVLGLAWIRRRVESKAIEKERKRSADYAERVNLALTEADGKIDEAADRAIAAIVEGGNRRRTETGRTLSRPPSVEEVRDLIEGSK